MRLETLCQGEPSPERWREIVEELERLGDGATPDLVERLNGLLEHWPDELRATMCRLDWDERMLRGEEDLRFRLFRHLKYDAMFIGRYTGIMMRSPKMPSGILGATNAPSTWSQLAIINLSGQTLVDDDVRALTQARLPFLEELRLDEVSHSAATMIVNAPWIAQLERLTISSTRGESLIQALGSVVFPKLEMLDLGKTGTSDRRAFTRWQMPALKTLRFSGAFLREAIAGLAAWDHALETLTLRSCGLEVDAMTTLAEGKLSFDKLGVEQNPLGDAGLEAIGAMPIVELGAQGCDIGDEGLEAFAQAEMKHLRVLSIGPESYGDPPTVVPTERGLNALLNAPHFDALEELTYTGELGPLRGPRLKQLKKLALETARRWDDERPVASIDGAALGPQLGSLSELRLSNVENAPALFSEPWVASLERVFLKDTPLDASSLAALGRAPLKWVVLDGCGIDARGLGVLLESSAQPEGLFLAGNPLGDRGAAMIAAAPFASKLERLGLSKCEIGDDGAFALADSELLEDTERVFLTGNPISAEGVDALARRLYQGWRALTVDERTQLLKDAPPRCCP